MRGWTWLPLVKGFDVMLAVGAKGASNYSGTKSSLRRAGAESLLSIDGGGPRAYASSFRREASVSGFTPHSGTCPTIPAEELTILNIVHYWTD